MHTNRFVRFALSVKTVLVGWRGQEVSFNTTVGGGVLLKDNFKWFY